jgi:prolyl oligopeptidase PreP (S9A serine peptidase family)
VESVETTRSSVVVNLIDNVRSRLLAFDWQDGSWHAAQPAGADSGVIEFADQPWNSDVLCYSFSDFLTPTGLYRLDVATGEHSCLRQQPAAFDASRLWPSSAGRRRPMVWTFPISWCAPAMWCWMAKLRPCCTAMAVLKCR